jgi:hypothetical protein
MCERGCVLFVSKEGQQVLAAMSGGMFAGLRATAAEWR